MERTLAELESDDPAWPQIVTWARAARHSVKILPRSLRGEQELVALQVTTRSPMGSIALETAGILVDRGWLRILGSGSDECDSSICKWNGLLSGTQPLIAGALLVAWDVVGGLFAVNDTAMAVGRGHVWYFGPDALDWLDMGMGYSGFLQWAFDGSLATFYENLRWPGWESEVEVVPADRGLLLYPFPWSQEGRDKALVKRSSVPASELLRIYLDTRRQLAEAGIGDEPEV